jgi:DNA-binding NtrC family response regulator
LPLGSVTTRKADVRIIATTNSQMDELISAGKFRRDLYYHLSVVTLEPPPLRRRHQDISLLIKHFMSYFAKKYAVSMPTLSEEALHALEHYRWPGNIRELRNLCENLTISRIGRTIELQDFPVEYRELCNTTSCAKYFELPELGLNWYKLEKDLIQQALEKTDGKCQDAAWLLGLSRDALYYRIKKYGLVLT